MTPPTILILAAGKGTRMHSATPKVLHELCGRAMVLWPVQAALEAGAGRVIVVDSPARAVEAILPDGVDLVVQPQSNGTGGAVVAAAKEIEAAEQANPGAPVVVLSGDVPLVSAEAIAELVAAHAASETDGTSGTDGTGGTGGTDGTGGTSGAPATMATTRLADPSGYGRVVRDSAGNLLRVVETKQAGDATPEELVIDEVNTGIYVFDSTALLGALPRLTSDNAQGELYLPQVLDLLRADGHAVAAHVVDEPGLVLGVNDRVALAEVTALAQQAINERHMRAGVTIVDPAATVIDVDVVIGEDTRIEPVTTIKGATRIGAGCTIRHSYIVDATIEDGVSVGPFADLRPGTQLHSGAKIGTFVEVKNSEIGAGAKVPHLSYIGDADVGEGSNLGAATITANYDGRAKHRTKVGRGVRTGVDTTLVAPVSVGDEAYTGAGSVITEVVPPGALGIARSRQVNKERNKERGG